MSRCRFRGAWGSFFQSKRIIVRINIGLTCANCADLILIAQLIISDAIIVEGSGEPAQSGTRLLWAAVAALGVLPRSLYHSPNFDQTFGV